MSDRLFDRYLVVDWSAANGPKAGPDSIWICVVGDDGPPVLSNPRTRRRAEHSIREVVDGSAAARERLLVAVDASLGFPAGTADLFGLPGEPWRAMWAHLAEHLHDDDHNRNDRFAVAAALNARTAGAGPFWGCPPAAASPSLTATKPPRTGPAGFGVGEYRACERLLRDAGRRPFSVWQLLGAGAVGSQTLTLLPVVERLLRSHPAVAVWPLTTGADVPAVDPGGVVVAEVWPSWFPIDVPAGVVKDARQVEVVAGTLRDADRSGELAGWFAPALDPADRVDVEREEGWVLGVLPSSPTTGPPSAAVPR